MTRIEKLLEQNTISQDWSSELCAHYIYFSERLMAQTPLIVKIGKGGLSYYKSIGAEQVFVCHFNAKPQSKRDDLGFADFRFDALSKHLDIPATLQTLQELALPNVQIKPHKLWCSIQFLLIEVDVIAELFQQHIISKLP
jgi:hypothetical protein